jgi:hypothetical protein
MQKENASNLKEHNSLKKRERRTLEAWQKIRSSAVQLPHRNKTVMEEVLVM